MSAARRLGACGGAALALLDAGVRALFDAAFF
jgi:hypothetical protein